MKFANVHATCVVCASAGASFGAPPDGGLLLLGNSGSGKSDLALRLIAMGALLVADDRCEIFLDDAVLHARVPHAIAGLMEIRGVGIVKLPFVPQARVILAVRTAEHRPDRLPERQFYRAPPIVELPEQLSPPEISIDAASPSAPARVLAALAGFGNPLSRDQIGT